SGWRVLRAGGRRGPPLQRSAAWAHLAVGRVRNLAEGRRLEDPRRGRNRDSAEDDGWEHAMIILDTALEAREQEGRPIRVGMIGAGFMGQGLTNQIVNSVRGMRMSAVNNRRPERAHHVYEYAGCEGIVEASTQSQVDDAIHRGAPVVAEDPFTICRSSEIDVVV